MGFLEVSIANTDLELLEFVYCRFSGTIKNLHVSGNRKEAWRWILTTNRAASFLRAIEPYVVHKRMKERIFLALAFQDQKQRNVRHFSPDDRELYVRAQVWYYQQFSAINHRGGAR